MKTFTNLCQWASKRASLGTNNRNRYYLFSITFLLIFGVSNVWAKETIASWGKVKFEAKTPIKASDGDAINKNVATLTSELALSSSGTNCYYSSGWTSGKSITMANLTTTNYTDLSLSFYSRGSQKGTITISVSTDKGSSYSQIATQTVTTSEKQYTINSNIPTGVTNIKFSYGAAGSFYFGTVTLSGMISDVEYSITLSENGETKTETITSASYQLPTELSVGSCDSKTFVGWTTTENFTSATTPTSDDYYAKGETVSISGDETFYAVFATSGGGGSATYSKTPTSSNDLVSIENGEAYTLTITEGIIVTISDWTNNKPVYHTDVQWRIYGGSNVNISSSIGDITEIAFESTQINLSTSQGTFSNSTWTGIATSVNFTNASTQSRITKISVTVNATTYTDYITTCSAPCDKTVTITTNTPENGSFTLSKESIETCSDDDADRQITLTLDPETNYAASTPTISNIDGATISGSDNSYTIQLPQNSSGTLNLNVTFECAAKLTFVLNSSEGGTYTVYKGTDANGESVNNGDVFSNCAQQSFYVTISPNSGYQLASFNVTNKQVQDPSAVEDHATITYSAGTKTTEYTITFAKLHTITWMVNGQQYGEQTTVVDGNALVLPTPPAAPSGCSDKVFMGWTASSSVNADGTGITYVDASTQPDGNKEYHAVFADQEGTPSTDYAKITSESELTDGNYVIAYQYKTEGTQIVLANTTKNTSQMNANALSLSENKYSNPADTYIWQILKQADDSYYIYNASVSKYLSATTSALQLSDDPTSYIISYDNTNARWKIQLKNNTSYYVHGYVDGSSYDFRASTNGDGTNYLTYLYKNTSTVVYTNYTTTCEVCANIINITKGEETGGTFTLNKSGALETCNGNVVVTVTPTPEEHFSVSSVTATIPTTGGAPSVTDNGDGTYTVTYAQNSNGESTINVSFVEDAKASITLSELGEPTTDNTTYYVGDEYTLPNTSSQSCDGKELVGWSTIEVPETDTKPAENYYELGAQITLAETQTFYAVFATADNSETLIAGGDMHTLPTGWTNGGTGTYASHGIKFEGVGDYILSPDLIQFSNSASNLKIKLKAGHNGGEGSVLTFYAYKKDNTKFQDDEITITPASITPTDAYTSQETLYEIRLSANAPISKIAVWMFTDVKNLGMEYCGIFTTTSYSAYTTLCDATKATITYDLNGGTGETCAKTTVTKDVEFTLCDQTPTKDGYTFAGWSDGTKTYAAGSSATVSESTTFYATWTPNTITITWHQNYNDCPESETSKYIYDGEEIEMPEDPTREGYKFIGWYTFPNEGTIVTEVGNTNKPTANVTYYARWAQLFTVTFMASGQNYVVQEHKYLSGDNLELPVENPSAANYACDGYIFEGWTDVVKPDEDATPRSLVTIATTIDRDQTFYALWKKATTEGAGETILSANFDNNNGTGGNDGKWNDNIATASIQLPANWNHANGYGANQCIKLGTGSKKGSVTTPALSSLSGKATLSFKAAAWDGSSESTTLVLSIEEGGGSLSQTSVTLTKGAWNSYEVTITGGTSSTRITFAGKNASDSRFFLDEVKVTTSGSYNYTTSPSCGPTIVAKDGMWVTSANSQSVKVNVPIAVKSFTTNATITGTTANTNFAVTTLENTGNGEHNLVVTYTPNASNIKEDATITLTAKDGEETISTTTFTINGRSLPDEFAIVVDKASEYFALPANMPSAGTYPGYSVTLNAGSVTSAPKTHLYTAQAVHNTRFAENGTALRLVGNNNACLWATNAVSGTDIRNYAQLDNAKTADYEWNLYTEDGDTYRISCSIVTEEGRILRMYGANFGMYKSGAEVFYLLPVECTSTPTNIQVSPARVSTTISWENAATCDLQVLKEGTPVKTISGAVSPVVVIGLEELTAYTFTLTPTDADNCKVDGAFTTTGPTIDIVEWETDGIVIQVDKDDNLNPKVVISGEVEHGDAGGNVADELFFSKYFEAHAENKLLAIFNGTTATIDLTGYTIKSENGTLDLSQFGQTKGKVASNEEIILVYYDANYSAEKCAEQQEGYENWNILTEKSVLAFSGRGSLGLYKNDVLIDVIGSTFPSGELTKIGKSGSPDNCGTDETVRLHIDDVSVNDQSSFFCFNGDNIKTDEVETNYALSTNRCLLIRKNTVTSGANAVASNKAAAGATCGDLSSTFTTLCSEWSGFRIGSGKSSTDEIKNATCDGLGYVGGFDYNNYYRTLETLDDSKTLEDYTRNADENTYFIEIENLAQYSCLNIQLQLADDEDNILTQQTSQVPILVTGEKSTTDPIFSAIVKDSETSEPDYETSKIRCSTCDVVILKDATLTKADAETVNDVNQVRDIYIYPGGKLVVPANATDYSVNNVSLRRVQDEVAAADIKTTLNITSSSKAPIFVDVRIDANNWHWFALPYDCNIADVTWADGSKAAYNTDWFLMYYDGESRAASTNPHDNHWKVYSGTTIEAGKGYIVGITGDVSKPAVKFELRFPMAQEVLTAEKEDKTVAVNAWGITKEIGPNNKGWNLVGNPYMDYYQPNTNGFAGLPLIHYTNTDPVTGKWNYENSGGVPYVVTPIDGGWYEYQQELASEVNMMPFTAYFVQVGDPATHENGQALDASFEASNRGKKPILRRAPSEVDEQEEPAIVAVSLTNAKGESDKTTLLIANRFTNEYEMNADFFKWFGDYYTYYTKPVLYTLGADNESRAFNALNEELAAQPVALGMYAAQAGEYTFSLYQRSELSRVEEVWLHDATSDTHTNLMLENYTFSTSKTDGAGRFSLSVKMKPKIATDIDDIRPGQVWATSQDNEVIVNGLNSGLQLWLYDAVGKLLYAEPTTNYQHRYTVPQDGVYFITVKDVAQVRTIKVVVE